MFRIRLRLPFVVNLLLYCELLQDHQALANPCREEFYWRPYIHLRKKRNGANLATVEGTGFLDLRFRHKMVLCIHGPVVLYSAVERLDPDQRLTSKADKSKDTLKGAPEARLPSPDHTITDMDAYDEELRFTKGELLVLNQDCILINKLPPDMLRKMREDQGRSKPEIMSDSPVQSRLALGAYLIGNKEDLKKPELAWFKGTNFDYIKSRDKTVKDSSFMMIGSNSNYCLRLPDGINLKLAFKEPKPLDDSREICRWTVQEEDKSWYSKLFQRGFDGNGIKNGEATLEEEDYKFFECPDSDDAKIILQMSKTTPEPVGHTNFTEFDPFSLFNPNMWTPHGYRRDSNGLSGGDERYEDKAMSAGASAGAVDGCSLDPLNPTCQDSSEMEMTTLKDLQNVDPTSGNSYEILASDCVPLPSFEAHFATCLSARGGQGYRHLEIVLELEPQFKPNRTDPNAEMTEDDIKNLYKYKTLKDNATLAWKHDLLYLVSDIFKDICMLFRPEMPYSVARLFAWYLYKAHLFGRTMGRSGPPPKGDPYDILSSEFDHLAEKNDPWPILIKELERCKGVAKNENGGKGLKFQWEVGDDTGRWKIPSVSELNSKKRRKKRSNNACRRQIKPVYETPPEKVPHDWNAEMEERILSRQKRAERHYKVNGSAISTKYVLPGKSLTIPQSEGTDGYARETIQEYRKKPDMNDPRADSAKYMDLPDNIQHCWNPQEDPMTKQIVCARTEDIFFFEERAELRYSLNIAIDLWWKIWSTVIGYCNKAYHSRKSETFPRLYNTGFEYFFGLVLEEWKKPEDLDKDLPDIFSEYMTEESQAWLDSCMEAAYINSNSQSFRPPRPMSILEKDEESEIPNYFEDLPSQLYYRYHPEPSVAM